MTEILVSITTHILHGARNRILRYLDNHFQIIENTLQSKNDSERSISLLYIKEIKVIISIKIYVF